MTKTDKSPISWLQTAIIFLTLVVGMSISYSTMYERIDAATVMGKDHETRVRFLERAVAEMAGDIKAIRVSIETRTKAD